MEGHNNGDSSPRDRLFSMVVVVAAFILLSAVIGWLARGQFNYEKDTGSWHWKHSKAPRVSAGSKPE